MENSLIYHYTSIAGLKGILGSEVPSLRVTDSRFLNDTREILHGVELASFEVSQRPNLGKLVMYNNNVPSAAEFIDVILKSIKKSLFFTTSFCREGDKLAQWVSYCPVDGGYAIGIDREQLSVIAKNLGFELHDVIYNPEPYKFIDSAGRIEKMFHEIGKDFRAQRDRKFYDLVTEAAREIVITKDSKFNTENEVRLFANRPNFLNGKNNTEFFEKNSVMVPFLPFSLPKDIIKEVIIGPMRHQDLAEMSLNMFKNQYDFNFNIICSDISLRTF